MKSSKATQKAKPNIEAVDLFCGAGGLTCGLERAGVKVLCGIDNDPKCEYPYSQNNNSKFILRQIEDTNFEDLLPFFSKGSVKLIAGCAPCQTFSRYNPKADTADTRWGLLSGFGRIVENILPEYVTIENVPGLLKQDIFSSFIKMLERKRYDIWYDIVDCSKYGLPQKRLRLVLIASRIGNLTLLSPEESYSETMTVRDAIGSLDRVEAGQVCFADTLHRTRNLTPINLKRIRHSVEGGTWRSWPKNLILNCHKKEGGQTYPSVYGRMEWDSPSPTITTQFYGLGNGRFGHPEQDRAISLREGAILQGFPNDYEFTPTGGQVSFRIIGRLIGNAVPVRLGEVIGMSFVRHLKTKKFKH